MRIGPFGVWEILIILIVVLLIFGPRRLPEMAKGLGQSVRAFRKEMRDFKSDFDADEQQERAAAERASRPSPQPAPPAPPVVTAPAAVDEPVAARDRAAAEPDPERKPV